MLETAQINRFLIHIVSGAALLLSCACCRSDKGSAASSTEPALFHEAPSFKLTIEQVGSYEIGKEGTALVRLASKGDYKINREYPFRFECLESARDGVSYPKPSLRLDDGKLEEREAVFSVPFVSQRSGTVRVGGELALSVCNEMNCVTDRRVVVVDVVVR